MLIEKEFNRKKMEVTVIIPVYNAEQYLEECVQSVLKQNFTDFELVLVNDGSSDRSGALCETYASADHRVRVFHQKNGGVSSARNLGIANAKGKWVTFIDADDYISPNYFDVLTVNSNADLIMQGLIYLKEGIEIKHIRYREEELEFEKFLSKYDVYPEYSSSWSKFFKRSILQKYEITFNMQLKFGEDTLFNLQYLWYCRSIFTADTLNYHYRILESGLSNSGYLYKHDLLLYRELKNQLEKYNNKKFYKKSIKIALERLSKSIFNDKTLERSERVKILKEIVETDYSILLQIYSNPQIKVFFVAAYYTGFYPVLDFVLSKINHA